jgi:hypothetical protein
MAIDVGRCSSTAEEGTSVTSEYGHVAFLEIVESRIKCWPAVVLKAPHDLGLADAVAFRSVDDHATPTATPKSERFLIHVTI